MIQGHYANGETMPREIPINLERKVSFRKLIGTVECFLTGTDTKPCLLNRPNETMTEDKATRPDPFFKINHSKIYLNLQWCRLISDDWKRSDKIFTLEKV